MHFQRGCKIGLNPLICYFHVQTSEIIYHECNFLRNCKKKRFVCGTQNNLLKSSVCIQCFFLQNMKNDPFSFMINENIFIKCIDGKWYKGFSWFDEGKKASYFSIDLKV